MADCGYPFKLRLVTFIYDYKRLQTHKTKRKPGFGCVSIV